MLPVSVNVPEYHMSCKYLSLSLSLRTIILKTIILSVFCHLACGQLLVTTGNGRNLSTNSHDVQTSSEELKIMFNSSVF